MNSENLFYKTKPSKICKEVTVPTSKSYANRVLILAATNPSPVTIKNLPESSDVKNMIRCFKQIGIDIESAEDCLVIKNSFPECEKISNEVIDLQTRDGGTTNRFLIPLLALGKNKYNLIPAEKMSQRPMKEMEDILLSLGVKVFNKNNWFCLQGPYQTNTTSVEVDCSETTQFATGFMLSLQKINISVVEKNLKTSVPYLLMTKELVKSMQQTYTVPVDFSSLSYPLALSLFGGEVYVPNCSEVDKYQADSIFIKLIKDIGASLIVDEKGLKLKGLKRVSALDVDCSDCPDLVPTLCFVAAYADGESFLRNVDVLRFKECDRLKEMKRMMSLFDVTHSYDNVNDVLSIKGRDPFDREVEVRTERDHRMVMVAHLFQRMNGGGLLHDIDCVEKSFPNYFTEMND